MVLWDGFSSKVGNVGGALDRFQGWRGGKCRAQGSGLGANLVLLDGCGPKEGNVGGAVDRFQGWRVGR